MSNQLPGSMSVIWPQTLSGARFVCEVPRALGPVTAMYAEGRKVVCETQSGADLVVSMENGIEAVRLREPS